MSEGRRGRYRQIGAVLRRHGLGVAAGMIGLAVMSREVVESADGCGSDCGVVPVMIVGV